MSDNSKNNLKILTEAVKLTKDLTQSEQTAVIGLLSLDPNSIKNEETRIQINGVRQNLIQKIRNGNIDKSMLNTVVELNKTFTPGPTWNGGRRKRRKSRKSLLKKKKTKKRRRKNRTKRKRRKSIKKRRRKK